MVALRGSCDKYFICIILLLDTTEIEVVTYFVIFVKQIKLIFTGTYSTFRWRLMWVIFFVYSFQTYHLHSLVQREDDLLRCQPILLLCDAPDAFHINVRLSGIARYTDVHLVYTRSMSRFLHHVAK